MLLNTGRRRSLRSRPPTDGGLVVAGPGRRSACSVCSQAPAPVPPSSGSSLTLGLTKTAAETEPLGALAPDRASHRARRGLLARPTGTCTRRGLTCERPAPTRGAAQATYQTWDVLRRWLPRWLPPAEPALDGGATEVITSPAPGDPRPHLRRGCGDDRLGLPRRSARGSAPRRPRPWRPGCAFGFMRAARRTLYAGLAALDRAGVGLRARDCSGRQTIPGHFALDARSATVGKRPPILVRRPTAVHCAGLSACPRRARGKATDRSSPSRRRSRSHRGCAWRLRDSRSSGRRHDDLSVR